MLGLPKRRRRPKGRPSSAPLDTLEDAQRWLRRLPYGAVALVPGAALGGVRGALRWQSGRRHVCDRDGGTSNEISGNRSVQTLRAWAA